MFVSIRLACIPAPCFVYSSVSYGCGHYCIDLSLIALLSWDGRQVTELNEWKQTTVHDSSLFPLQAAFLALQRKLLSSSASQDARHRRHVAQ